METIFLETGEDLESQLRRQELRKRKSFLQKLSRGQLIVLGMGLLASGGCCVGGCIFAVVNLFGGA